MNFKDEIDRIRDDAVWRISLHQRVIDAGGERIDHQFEQVVYAFKAVWEALDVLIKQIEAIQARHETTPSDESSSPEEPK